MTALIVIGAIILFFAAFLLTRAGLSFTYSEEGVILSVRYGFFKMQLIPAAKKSKIKKRDKRPKAEKHVEKDKKGGTFELVKKILPIIPDTLGRLRRKLVIKNLVIRFTSASSDPADAAMNFGRASLALGFLIPVLDNCFRIRERDIDLDVSFQDTENLIYLHAAISIALGSLIYIALRFGLKFYRAYNSVKTKNQEDEQNG